MGKIQSKFFLIKRHSYKVKSARLFFFFLSFIVQLPIEKCSQGSHLPQS